MWMKRFVVLLLASFTTISFQGCESDDDDSPANGEINETIFHNKIWSGMMKVTYHNLDEAFSLSFKEDGSVEWFHANVKMAGTYTVNTSDKKLNVSFPSYKWDGPTFTADIISATELKNFTQADDQIYKIQSCNLNTTTTQNIVGTTWEGTFGTHALKFRFISESVVEITVDGEIFKEDSVYGNELGYLRIQGTIDYFFGVLFDDTLKGIYSYASQEYYPMEVHKK